MDIQKAKNLVITDFCFNLRLIQDYKLKTAVFGLVSLVSTCRATRFLCNIGNHDDMRLKQTISEVWRLLQLTRNHIQTGGKFRIF